MNLLYNLVATQPIHSAKFHGGGSYGEVIFFALLERLNEFNMFCVYDGKKYLNPAIAKACRESNVLLCDVNEISPSEIIIKYKIDTFYTPLYSLEKKWNIKVARYCFTWHGVRALEIVYSRLGIKFAKTFMQKLEAFIRYREFWKKFYYAPKYRILAEQIAEGKVSVITVSEHSRASIKAFFPKLMNAKIPVFYSPMSENLQIGEESQKANEALPNEIEPKKYFLLTSGARWEKNNLRAAVAFDNLNYGNFKMLITGVPNPKIYQKKLIHKERFVFLNYVENEYLEFLHKNAYAFIFPSLNEGFGYPPIMSMRYGVPVAASGTTSIPEICGDAAIYFDPYSVSEIKNRIIQLLDEKIYSEYSTRAIARYKIVNEKQKQDLVKSLDFILNIK